MGERLADVVQRSAHQENYRLMREHRDAAERLLAAPRPNSQLGTELLCEVTAHATLALFYQREVNQ